MMVVMVVAVRIVALAVCVCVCVCVWEGGGGGGRRGPPPPPPPPHLANLDFRREGQLGKALELRAHQNLHGSQRITARSANKRVVLWSKNHSKKCKQEGGVVVHATINIGGVVVHATINIIHSISHLDNFSV
jgi:hypothetical protein